MKMRWLFAAVLVLAMSQYSYAQSGTYAFPQKGQTPDQQKQDEGSCAQWAKGQTGIDPAVLQYRQQEAAADQQQASQAASNPQTGRKLGRAAVTGAAMGQMNKNMDDGAGKGAAMGVTLAASKARGAKVEADKQAPVNAANAQSAGVQADSEKFTKAYCACMEGKGYSIR
jgi:hypothetical protein